MDEKSDTADTQHECSGPCDLWAKIEHTTEIVRVCIRSQECTYCVMKNCCGARQVKGVVSKFSGLGAVAFVGMAR